LKMTQPACGLVYDRAFLAHSLAQHPEGKERLEHILAVLQESGHLARLPRLTPRYATTQEIATVHTAPYIRSVEVACQSGEHYLDPDTYIVPESYEVALLAAGSALIGLAAIMEGALQKVFVLCRPPGHHAEYDRAMGFCLFNNVAIAARVALDKYGLKRIAIIDWDAHHGNGTQNTFYTDPSVLVISLHHSPGYPGTGHLNEVGRGQGRGYNINIPLPGGCHDADYALFFDRVIIPVLDAYQPELIIISAGQDAYHKDPLGGMQVTWQGFDYMARALTRVAKHCAQGRMLLCLEGGYHLNGAAQAVRYIIDALLEHPDMPPSELPPAMLNHGSKGLLAQVIALQGEYWPLSNTTSN